MKFNKKILLFSGLLLFNTQIKAWETGEREGCAFILGVVSQSVPPFTWTLLPFSAFLFDAPSSRSQINRGAAALIAGIGVTAAVQAYAVYKLVSLYRQAQQQK